MKVKFYQVFETVNEVTTLKLCQTYYFSSKSKISSEKINGFYIITPYIRKHNKSALKQLIVSSSQLEQIRIAYKKGQDSVTISELYTSSELRQIIKEWNPLSVSIYSAAPRSDSFHRVASFVCSNLGGEFFGKFLLPTSLQTKLYIDDIVQACIDGRK